MTIQCAKCAAFLVLGPDIQESLRGRTGRLPCKACGEKLRLDGRFGKLSIGGGREVHIAEVELDEVPAARGEQLSLLPAWELRDEPEEVVLPRAARVPVVPRPPRPSLAPRPELRSDPFDELGSLAPVVPLQGVHLTSDGRLVNRADEVPAKRSRSRVRTWSPLMVAAVLATGLASAHVGSILPLGRAPRPVVKQTAAFTSAPPDETVTSAAAPSVDVEPAAEISVPEGAPILPPPLAPSLTESRASHASSSLPRAEETPQEAPDAAPADPGPTDAGGSDSGGSDAEASEVALEAPESSDDEAPSAFSREAATVALQHAAAEALSCRQAGDPAGSARVIVTFAPSGRVTSANVASGPFAGTSTGGCIAGRFRGATVPAFDGGYVTVSKTISVQ